MRIVLRLLGALAGLVLAYTAAALVGSYIPVHDDWKAPWSGTRIYVADNGIHTDLVLPARDFADLVRPQHFREGRAAAQGWLMFGWGDRDFYLSTPSWWQLNPWKGAKALVGAGSTVLHVMHVREPAAGPRIRPLNLRPEEYRKLVDYVRATFARGEVVQGYGGRDAFYPAKGGYSLIRTCNEWTAGGLRAAGVRMGAWTPLPFGVMAWL